MHALEVSEDLGSELLFRRTNGTEAFWLRTPQAEGVTNLDIEVAKWIDALLLAVDTADLPPFR
jgi:hypothetical protein